MFAIDSVNSCTLDVWSLKNLLHQIRTKQGKKKTPPLGYIEIITSLCKIIHNSGMIPTEMKHSVIVTLPKKPKAMNCTEFITISLMSHVTKLLLKIIRQRIANKIDKEVSRLQSSFRPGTGTWEGIFNLRTICERATDVQKMCIYALPIIQKLLIKSHIWRW